MIDAINEKQADFGRMTGARWSGIALSTEPVPHDVTERGIVTAYKAAGLSPATVRWFPSPIKGLSAAAQVLKSGGRGVLDELWQKQHTAVWDAITKRVSDNVLRVAERELATRVMHAAHPLVNAIASEMSIRALVIGDKYPKTAQMLNTLIGPRFSLTDEILPKLAMAAFCGGLGVAKCDRLAALSAAIVGVGWMWPFDKVVIACDRPTRLAFDKDGQPHCEDGLAIEYADGYGAYCWHGQAVPKEAIDGDVEWDTVQRAADKDVQKAVVDVAAKRWSVQKDPAKDETADERYEAAMAAQRLGGVEAVGELVKDE